MAISTLDGIVNALGNNSSRIVLDKASIASQGAGTAALGLPEILNGSCLFPVVLTSTTSSGTVRGGGKIAHG